MGLGLVYGGIRIKGRPVATEHDFYSTHESLRLRFGDFEQIRLYDDPAQATVAGMVEAARGVAACRAARPHLGALGHWRQDPGAGDRRGRAPALVVLDGVHGLAADDLPIDSVDVLVAGTHKWLGGPRGTGLVWSGPGTGCGRSSRRSTRRSAGRDWNPGGYHTFEHRWALAEAFDFHHRIGRTKVTKRIQSLATRLKEGLAELPKVRLVTPMAEEVSAGIVCFEVDGLDPVTAVERLRREHRSRRRSRPTPQPYVRLGTGLWVDEADVDAALSAIARL